MTLLEFLDLSKGRRIKTSEGEMFVHHTDTTKDVIYVCSNREDCFYRDRCYLMKPYYECEIIQLDRR